MKTSRQEKNVFRREHDALGPVDVPADRYYGAQTARARIHFQIGRETFPPEFIRALGRVKLAAARANRDLGVLDPRTAGWIEEAALQVVSGGLDGHFPLSVWQTGSGTQMNMNMNEVIANRAIELSGGRIGSRTPVHPNDHVNRGQSTNDVFPTAMHLAAAEGVLKKLLPALQRLSGAFRRVIRKHGSIVKIGRTHLMDAVPLTLGQEFSAYVTQIEKAGERIRQCLPRLYELPIGGTAVGTGLNTHPRFASRTAAHLKKITRIPWVPAENPFEGIAAHDAVVFLSGALKTLAVSLSKIANDLRWLGSGPRSGLGELVLPANEPGSSIMPGKVNPTQCEALLMVSARVIGNDATISLAGAGGNFELNCYKPLLACTLLQSIRILADAVDSFTKYCVRGINVDRERIRNHLESSLMLVTALAPRIGYDRASEIAHKAYHEKTTIRRAALELGIVSGEEFDRIVRPERMTAPGKKSRR